MAKKKKEKAKLHPLEEGFNELNVEFREFKKSQLAQYEEAGQQIDTKAFEGHFKTVFLWGKVNDLLKEVSELRKGDTNVKQEKGNKGKSRASRKTDDGDDNQLQLGL